MRNILLPAVMGLTIALAGAGRPARRVPLRPEDIRVHPALMRRTMLQSYAHQRRKPPGLRAGPADADGHPFYAEPTAGGAPLYLAALKEHGKPRLFVDRDRDSDLSDEAPVPRSAEAAGRFAAGEWFGPVAVPSGPGAGGARSTEVLIQVGFMGSDFCMLTLCPATALVGELRADGKAHLVAVADKNRDGRPDGRFGPDAMMDCDWLGLDADADGELNQGEVMPLPRRAKLGDVYYEIDVAPDGSALELRETQPRFGTLDVDSGAVQLTLVSDSGVQRLSGQRGAWSLPAGFYHAVQMGLEQTDEEGRLWEVTCSDTGELILFNVRPDETLRLEAGPPVAVKRQVRFRDGTCSIGITAHGRAGEEYSAQVTRDGEPSPPPKVRIRSREGKVLSVGRFRYG